MTQKIKISKPTYNALTETNPDNIIFSSDYDSLKYHVSGSVVLEVTGSNAETNITHGLGYIPFFVVYVNGFKAIEGNFSNQFSMCPGAFNDFGFYSFANSYADNDKIYFKVETNTDTFDYTFYYKVFRNNTGL